MIGPSKQTEFSSALHVESKQTQTNPEFVGPAFVAIIRPDLKNFRQSHPIQVGLVRKISNDRKNFRLEFFGLELFRQTPHKSAGTRVGEFPESKKFQFV